MIGPSSFSAYMGNDGQPHGQIEIDADEVEFLSPKGQNGSAQDETQAAGGGTPEDYQ